jgi:general transcription factor 3C polypeptide 5 (transcription factor C subunit 1)
MVDKDAPQVPQAPSPHLDPLSTSDAATQLCVSRLRVLFAERPITTRRAVFNSYLNRYGPGNANSTENWRPILRFCLPHVCYMFQSGPYRDAYMIHGLDPRKDSKWARYQTVFFNFRGVKGRKVQESVEDLLKNSNNHLFTGRDINSQVVCYSCADIVDPILRKLLDESPLRETFHVSLLMRMANE